MEHNPRRQFLTGMLRGLGVTLLASVPGTFFYARKAWSQVQRVTTAPRTVSTVTTIKSAIAKTTPRNVIQVLKTSRLVPEDKLAVLAVRQLSAGEVKQSLDKFNKLFNPTEKGAGTDCGIGCGSDCGESCGSDCGSGCGFTCDGSKISSHGVFCGSGCHVQPGAIGVIDVAGKLGINFRQLNVDAFRQSMTQVMRLVR